MPDEGEAPIRSDPACAAEEIHACCTLDARQLSLPLNVPVGEAISLRGKTWQPGDTVEIGFLDGSATQRSKCQRWIEYWLPHVNLRFRFGAPGPAIRISFRPGGSWSFLGTDCLNVPTGPTFQLGWVTDTSDDVADRAVIVHEMGHALGLGHEQSNPSVDIKWDKPKAMHYFMTTQGWSAEMVETQVFMVYDYSDVYGTPYDRNSIMQYPVPAELTLDNRGIPWNSDLDDTDKMYAGLLYPATSPPTPTPTPVPTPTPTPTPTPVPPVPTPTPPTPTPGRPPAPVVIGRPAAHRRIAAAGEPAAFGMDVPEESVLRIAVVIDSMSGREPVLVAQRGGDAPRHFKLTQGRTVESFPPGHYLLYVYNPYPRLTGKCWVKATRMA